MPPTRAKRRRPSASDDEHDFDIQVPFGADVLEKTQEELDLEEKLFGTRSRAPGTGARRISLVERRDEDPVEGLDSDDLFMVDAPVFNGGNRDGDDDLDSASTADDASDAESEATSSAASRGIAMNGDGEIGADGRTEDPTVTIDVPLNLTDEVPEAGPSRSRKTIWTDPSDELIQVDLTQMPRLRKLGRGTKGGRINGLELEKRLRQQFERIHPRPAWASQRTTSATPSLTALLSSTKSFVSVNISPGAKRPPLPRDLIELRRLINVNVQSPSVVKKGSTGGGVVDHAWHPNRKVPVVAVAGGDRRVRFFNIDGHTNSTLLTLHIPSLPITKTTFHPSGSSVLLAGTRPYFYTYDLPSQRCLRSSKLPFGSQSLTTPLSLSRHAFSPDGKLLAVAGRRGCVSVLDYHSCAILAELKSGRGGSVSDLIWDSPTTLSVLGGRNGSEVESWDVGERKIVSKWSDDRSFGGLAIRSGSGFAAIGCSTGLVNLYDSTLLRPTNGYTETSVEPIKELGHLTTPISDIAFHPSGEMMVSASAQKSDALKLYHLPSATAFSNWPRDTTPLGKVTSTTFSPGGEYLSVGNQKGIVLLWSLKHYAS